MLLENKRKENPAMAVVPICVLKTESITLHRCVSKRRTDPPT